MKIVILGNTNNPVTGKAEDPYSWFVLTYRDGFLRNGHEVLLIDYRSNSLSNIKSKIASFKPNFVFTHLTFHNTTHSTKNTLELFRSLNKRFGTKFIHVCGDARTQDRYMGDISDYFYACLVNNYELLENGSKSWKVPTFYSPYSSLTYHNIAEPIQELKFKKPIFTGSPNAHPDRKQFITLLEEYGCIKTFKTQSNNDLRNKTPELSSSANSILGLCTGYDIEGFIDVRPWQYMGTGACFIGRKFKGMDNLIPDEFYYSFNGYTRNDAVFIKKLSMKLLKEDTWPMRCKAFRFMQQNHSSVIRMKNTLEVLEGKKERVI